MNRWWSRRFLLGERTGGPATSVASSVVVYPGSNESHRWTSSLSGCDWRRWTGHCRWIDLTEKTAIHQRPGITLDPYDLTRHKRLRCLRCASDEQP